MTNILRSIMVYGHVTGSFAGGGGVAVKDFKGAGKHSLRSWSTDLAKLNP